MRILVKDVAKKLQATIERRNADTESGGVREGGRSKYSVPLSSDIVVLKDPLSGQSGWDVVPILPAGRKDPHRSPNGCSACGTRVPQLTLVLR
jgi:hypothetical protein